MAELVEAENGDVEASREWLRRASLAAPDSAWVCNNCGNTVADWEPVCERCKKFDCLEWQTPPRVTRMEFHEDSGGVTETLQSLSDTIDVHKSSGDVHEK